ncbi:MAG: AAA family ATPase [Nitrososphaeria archaeon]|nr:AAA family ATPase [Nitrososphaeria archaeon]
MKIVKVEIKNYRSIKHTVFYPTSFCVLIGENNAGKSNILSAINKVLGSKWPTPQTFSDTDFYGMDKNNPISISVWFNLSEDDEVYFSQRGLEGEIIGIRLQYPATEGTELNWGKVEYCYIDKDGNKISRPYISKEDREKFSMIYIDVNRDLQSHLPTSQWTLLGRMLKDINKELESDSKRRESFIKSIRGAMYFLRTEKFKKLEELIKFNASKQLGIPKEDLEIKFQLHDPYNFYKTIQIFVKEDILPIRVATEMGLGAQNAIVFSIFQAYAELGEKNIIFAIEEPELFLHPHARRHFYKVLRELSGQNQIFIATHSSFFVDLRNHRDICIVRKLHGKGTLVYQSDYELTPYEKEKVIKEFDPERNELFFAKKILLVEGDTEKLSFPIFAEKMKIDLDQEGISIVETGGKKNLSFFAKIIGSFEIPCLIVFDEDSSDFSKNEKDKESEFNKELLEISSKYPSLDSVMIPKNFDEFLKKHIGQERYEELCNKYPGYKGKPIKFKVISEELSIDEIPYLFKEILTKLIVLTPESILNKDLAETQKSENEEEPYISEDDLPF